MFSAQAIFDQEADLVIPVFFQVASIHPYARFQERASSVKADIRGDVVPHIVRVAHHVIFIASLDPYFAADIADVGQMRRDAMWDIVEDCYRILKRGYCRKPLSQG